MRSGYAVRISSRYALTSENDHSGRQSSATESPLYDRPPMEPRAKYSAA